MEALPLNSGAYDVLLNAASKNHRDSRPEPYGIWKMENFGIGIFSATRLLLHYVIDTDIRELDAIILKALESYREKHDVKLFLDRLYPILKEAAAVRMDLKERNARRAF